MAHPFVLFSNLKEFYGVLYKMFAGSGERAVSEYGYK